MKLRNTMAIFLIVTGLCNIAYGERKVFILSGQSNMVGYGKTADLSASQWSKYTFPFPKVTIYGGFEVGELNPTALQLKPGCFIPTFFGPELTIGEVLLKRYPADEIILIKAAQGSTGLETNWLNNTGNIYGKFKDGVRASLSKIATPFTLCGFFWMQGESDACADQALAQRYAANLKTFVEQKIRADMTSVNAGFKTIPFVYGIIRNDIYGDGICTDPAHTSPKWPFGSIVQDQQKNAQAMIAMSRCVTETSLEPVWHPEGPYGFDRCHYNNTGVLNVGSHLAKGLVGIWSMTSQTAMPQPVAGTNIFPRPENMRVAAVTSPADGYIQVIRTKYYDTPSQLIHYFYNPATGTFIQGGAFGSNCWGTPSLCVNPYNNNNLEVVTLNNAIKKFDVYFRDQASLKWYGPTASFASNVSSSPVLLCNTYGSCVANLEVYYRDGNKLRHYFRLNSDGIWRDAGNDGITATDINGDPALVQDANGRFHIVVRVSNNSLRHYIRSANTPYTWSSSTISLAGTNNVSAEAPGLLYNKNKNTVEMVIRQYVNSSITSLRHFRFANNAWSEITSLITGVLVPGTISGYSHQYIGPVLVMGRDNSSTLIDLIGVEKRIPTSGTGVAYYGNPFFTYEY